MKIFKKEKAVAEAAFEYLESVEQCVRTAEQAILDYLEGKLEDTAAADAKVGKLEARADELRRSIRDKLFSGAYLPLMRGDIHRLIESMDGVANAAESCVTAIHSQQPHVPDEFKQAFAELTRDSFGIIGPLKSVVTAFFKPKGKVKAIQGGAQEVAILESVVDEKELALTVQLFESASLDLAGKLHLRKVLDHIVKISDRAEDTADRLVLIAIKSVT